MSTRQSGRILRGKKPLLNELDKFKHTADDGSDVDMSDSHKEQLNPLSTLSLTFHIVPSTPVYLHSEMKMKSLLQTLSLRTRRKRNP